MSVETACPTCGEQIPSDAPLGACPGCLLLLAASADEPELSFTVRMRPPSIEKLQEFFPQYRVETLIGVGGQGVVYRAHEPSGNRRVALKILTVEQSANPEFLSRFALEAETLSKLAHPGIVQVCASGQAGDYFYIATQWVEGTTLREIMREKPLEARAAGALIMQICEALEFAHARGVIHRDLKPENILIGGGGKLYIADFGIAKLLGKAAADDPQLTATHARLGTARYMAPEQMRGDAVIDAGADVYALGVMLFELLTGELPLPFGLPPSKIAGSPPAYDRIVARSMRPYSRDRFPSAAELRRQLRIAATSWLPRARRAAVFAATCAASVALVFGGFLWGKHARSNDGAIPPPGVASLLGSDEWKWSEPENLGPLVNTPGNDHSPFISADGLTLLYHGRGHERLDHVDIWQCQRATTNSPWGKPENLGPDINSEHWEGDPCLSDDGLRLFFSAEWRDSRGTFALFEATRPDRNAPWSNIKGTRVSQERTTDHDRGPLLSPDKLTLWYSRGTADRGFDLMMAHREALGETFSLVEPIGPPINSPAIESDPHLSADGLTILWSAPYSATAYDQELWWSYRTDPTADWQPPRKLSPVISFRGACEPSLSADGRELYFASARIMNNAGDPISHQGGTDIYVSRRVRKASPTDSAARAK